MTCPCPGAPDELIGPPARELRQHLEKVAISSSGWEITYRCPETGQLWLKDNPEGEFHGGGPIRMRRLPSGIP